MFSCNLPLSRLSIVSACILGLSACTPSFETTSEKCSAISPVSLAIEQTLDNTEFQVNTNSTSNDYKLYLEDALNSLKDIQSKDSEGVLSPLSEDEETTIQFVKDKANQHMGYSIIDGIVAFANNPLDYIESLIAATAEDEVIETFVDAKRNLADAVSGDDSVCSYRNDKITLRVEDSTSPAEDNASKKLNVQLNMSYNPYNEGDAKVVDQIVLITEKDQPETDRDDENEIEASLKRFYSGINRIAGKDFQEKGVSPSEVRQLTISDNQTSETYFFDDDFDSLKLGQIVSSYFNSPCLDDEGEQTACTNPVSNWKPRHEACNAGIDPNIEEIPDEAEEGAEESEEEGTEESDAEDIPNETGQIRVNGFTIVPGNPDLTDIQRFRVEVDYNASKNEIRVYASKYAEAILKAGAASNTTDPDDMILNPTNCEKQAILDDLLNEFTEEEQKSDDFEGVRLTLVPDPNYDVIYVVDEEGEPVIDEETGEQEEIEPTPIFTFSGPFIPVR